jgi:hypothetical protein
VSPSAALHNAPELMHLRRFSSCSASSKLPWRNSNRSQHGSVGLFGHASGSFVALHFTALTMPITTAASWPTGCSELLPPSAPPVPPSAGPRPLGRIVHCMEYCVRR